MKKILVSSLMAVILMSACKNESTTTEIEKTSSLSDSTAAVNEINKTDSLWDDQSAQNSVKGWLSFYSDDAIVLPPGENICKDKASREAVIQAYFSTPGAKMRFHPTKTEVSKSGDLGYSTGVYQFSFKDPTGKDAHENGKFNEIWKKQSDGNWKCIVDIWNADHAAK